MRGVLIAGDAPLTVRGEITMRSTATVINFMLFSTGRDCFYVSQCTGINRKMPEWGTQCDRGKMEIEITYTLDTLSLFLYAREKIFPAKTTIEN